VFEAIVREANVDHMGVVGHGVRAVGLVHGFELGQAMAAHAEEYLYTEFRDSAPAQREALPSIVQRVRKLVRGRVGGR